jgi:molybdopterin-guanine dinucleotide biosynthesis protein A
MQAFEGAVLAGGESSRMGRDKALLEWEGKPLIQRVAEVVSSVCHKIRIIADRPKRFSFLGLEICPDKIYGMGPLGGIYTALQVSESERVFCVACDMPFLDAETIRGMLDISPEYDVVVPYSNDDFHPLHAVYSSSCMEPIEQALKSASPRVIDFFDRVRVKTVEEKDFPALSPKGKALVNLNTPADLENYLSHYC